MLFSPHEANNDRVHVLWVVPEIPVSARIVGSCEWHDHMFSWSALDLEISDTTGRTLEAYEIRLVTEITARDDPSVTHSGKGVKDQGGGCVKWR